MLSANRSTSVTISGKDYLYFGGTNYLGLAHRVELLRSAEKAFSNYGFSSGASRLTSGENELLLALEQELADFARAEAALVLPAGFMSNQAVVEGIDSEVDAWVVTRQAHPSIQAAVRQSRKPIIEVESQQDLVAHSARDRRSTYACLGIFAEPIEPLTGKLSAINQLLPEAGATDFVILDEAQSFAVLGETGRGALEHFAVRPTERLIRTGTFSKALGTYGGFVLSSKTVIDLIKQKSACVRGSTSLPPLLCEATRESIRLILADADSTVLQLKRNIALQNQLLFEANFAFPLDNCVPIYYLPFSPEVAQMRKLLPEHSIYVPAMSNYFPGAHEVGMRWTIQSGHKAEDFKKLVEVFACAKISS